MAPVIKQVLSFASILVLVSCSPEPAALRPDAPVLSTAGGEVIGQRSQDGRTESFLGVPFAQPPVGDLRWAPPVPLIGMGGRFQATSFAPACMQADRITKWYRNVIRGFGGDPNVVVAPEVSEDCLYLNIWRPKQMANFSASHPVIVYIHGGSNKAGWSYEPNYIGQHLAADGVVVISVAYRLGAFGFFSHPEFEYSNFGLLDLVEALRWVNGNIQAIGGDPNRITVMGESAGAGNIDYLMAMPAAAGLFSRAIHQSSGSALSNTASKDDHSLLGLALAKQVAHEEATAEQLRQVSAQRVLASAEQVYSGHYFDNAVDGRSIMEPLTESLKAKRAHTTDLLIGSNEHESLMYLNEDLTVEAWMQTEARVEDRDKLQQLVSHLPSERAQLNALSTAKTYTCPALQLAEGVASLSGRAWVYYFDRQRDGEMAATMGAYHGAELPYIFDTHDDWLPTSQTDRQLTDVMQHYWINFATTGNPNGDKVQPWPAYSGQSSAVMILGDNIDASDHPQAALCELLRAS